MKTSSVLNEAIMSSLKIYLFDQLSKEPYALVNDGSSDTGVNPLTTNVPII